MLTRAPLCCCELIIWYLNSYLICSFFSFFPGIKLQSSYPGYRLTLPATKTNFDGKFTSYLVKSYRKRKRGPQRDSNLGPDRPKCGCPNRQWPNV